mmetsp:Transcript_31519/g.57269  ORF Transcript_31519/g.57269 Transcript_31519/m.57269 type:complete len:213 (+) Transcript_31519:416-1054(+)
MLEPGVHVKVVTPKISQGRACFAFFRTTTAVDKDATLNRCRPMVVTSRWPGSDGWRLRPFVLHEVVKPQVIVVRVSACRCSVLFLSSAQVSSAEDCQELGANGTLHVRTSGAPSATCGEGSALNPPCKTLLVLVQNDIFLDTPEINEAFITRLIAFVVILLLRKLFPGRLGVLQLGLSAKDGEVGGVGDHDMATPWDRLVGSVNLFPITFLL